MPELAWLWEEMEWKRQKGFFLGFGGTRHKICNHEEGEDGWQHELRSEMALEKRK